MPSVEGLIIAACFIMAVITTRLQQRKKRLAFNSRGHFYHNLFVHIYHDIHEIGLDLDDARSYTIARCVMYTILEKDINSRDIVSSLPELAALQRMDQSWSNPNASTIK